MERKRKMNWTHQKKNKLKHKHQNQKKLKGSGWSELPPDLLRLILKRLILKDYLRFSSVCKLWHDIVIEKPQTPEPQLPWLMLKKEGCTRGNYTFCSFPEGMRVYEIRQTKSESRGCCRIWEGWLVMRDCDNLKYSLLNPFSKAEIQLPHQSTMLPSLQDLRQKEEKNITTINYIRKIIMSSTDMIVAICGVSCYLAFCRVGDETWSSLENQSGDYDIIDYQLRYNYTDVYHYYDIIFYNGKLYAATHITVDVYNIDGGTSPKLMNRIRVPDMDPWKGQRKFVESCGDLLLVLKKTFEFHVFKLKVDENGISPVRWSRMKSLGNQVLFLSKNNLLCFSADSFPVLEGNHIYFSRNYKDDYDVGIFSMQDGSIKPFKFLLPFLTFNSAWFVPKL